MDRWTKDTDSPDYERPEVVEAKSDLELIHDLLEGTRRVHDRAREAEYLRKWKDESDENYNIRRTCEPVFEGLGRVLSAAVGMLWARQPDLVWNQAETAMTPHWENLDGAGTSGSVLSKRFSDMAIRDGLGLILVDHTPAPTNVPVTMANQQVLGLRPVWSVYGRKRIKSWRTATVNNETIPVQVVLQDDATEPDGEYGVATVTRYLRLVLTRQGAGWIRLRKTDNAMEQFVVEGSGIYRDSRGQPLSRLPLAIAYTGRTDAPFTATMPLLGVAWANLAHWRKSTNLCFAEDVAAFAQAVIKGTFAKDATGQPGKLKLGPLSAVHLVGEDAAFDWKSPPTEAFEPLRVAIKEKLEQIGQMGMSFLVSDTRAAETAEAKRLDATAENSTLATAAQGIEDAINSALEIHARYVGIERAGAPVMTINKDFDSVAMDAETMKAYVLAIKDAGFPPSLLLQAWQAGGRIPADVDIEELEREMLANSAAQAENDMAQLEVAA